VVATRLKTDPSFIFVPSQSFAPIVGILHQPWCKGSEAPAIGSQLLAPCRPP
jgi:hypothetical protein